MSKSAFWNERTKTDFTDVRLESFDAIPAKDEPDLKRPETSAQTQMPISKINDGASIFLVNKMLK